MLQRDFSTLSTLETTTTLGNRSMRCSTSCFHAVVSHAPCTAAGANASSFAAVIYSERPSRDQGCKPFICAVFERLHS